jgi:hypothetical protein
MDGPLRAITINDGVIVTVNDVRGDAVPLSPLGFSGHGRNDIRARIKTGRP